MIATPRKPAGALGAADWLGLAAAPTFALMALITALPDGGMPDMPCGSMHEAWPLGGMAVMYLLMSGFHLTPWLRLVARRRDRAQHA